MIEAVNSVLSNASLLRGNAEQASAARAYAANPERSQEVPAGPRAPYISPYIYVDVNFNKAVLQIRDSDTGDVLRQFPSESTLEARQRAELTSGGRLFSFEDEQPTPEAPEINVQTPSVNAGSSSVKPPAANAQAQVAAAALASAAQAGQVFTGAVSQTA